MKPVTVISASGPRRIAAQDPAPATDDGDGRGGVSRLVWAGVAAAVLAVVLGYVVLGGGGEEDPGVVVPSGSVTPSPLVPDVLTEAPTLTGRRTARGVLFEWNAPVELEEGDSFSYYRDDTQSYGTTTKRRLLVRTPDPICLDLRMTRGSDNSPSVNQCVT